MQSFINMMGNRQFAILASQADFKNQLESGMIWHSMESQLKNGALERSNLGTARNSLALGSSSVAGDEKAGR
jgi:hypothetical protein